MKYLLLPDDEQAIRDLLKETEQQFGAGNFSAARNFYAEDAVLMMPGAPAVHGVDAIQAELERALGQGGVRVTLDVDEVRVASGRDMAYVYGTARAVPTDPAAAPAPDLGTKWLTVFGRSDDGAWRVVADMFNSTE
jgi:uncharacterized protein (TIGR02246 family)